MFGVLLVLFIVVPLVELAVIVQIADQIGLGLTIVTLVLFSVAGAWLVKREGYGVLRRMQDQLDRGEIPTTELVNGVLVLVAGAMLLFPGFVTDTLGLLLLLPPVRAAVRTLLFKRFQHRVAAAFGPGGTSWVGPGGAGFASGRVFTGSATYDPWGAPVVDVHEVRPDDGEPPRLERP